MFSLPAGRQKSGKVNFLQKLRQTFPRANLQRQIFMAQADVGAKTWAKTLGELLGHFRASFAVQSDPPEFLPKFFSIYHFHVLSGVLWLKSQIYSSPRASGAPKKKGLGDRPLGWGITTRRGGERKARSLLSKLFNSILSAPKLITELISGKGGPSNVLEIFTGINSFQTDSSNLSCKKSKA